ncbi:hypothetical protein BO82DRAFT_156924 [Aspergillus uvarum CBS 121591]|uniref:Uncharacterized protein n=1 Tax=Aspergillus uvarum CBS 121591 TaxID=1448315 RepID=A0A319BXM0_9EURO|nr:hypothetical protein BO82DRAFT_156924 [Aspergillus uvarum CBS 121591]PYH78446.1 hypothetical protein BO82DRAFT_156924 [Aspergillus uvarum CBS 121591]
MFSVSQSQRTFKFLMKMNMRVLFFLISTLFFLFGSAFSFFPFPNWMYTRCIIYSFFPLPPSLFFFLLRIPIFTYLP